VELNSANVLRDHSVSLVLVGQVVFELSWNWRVGFVVKALAWEGLREESVEESESITTV
jgi:hypothetical protein